ncbi:MAG: hypothetical protein RL208_304, partial [Pseudomonadota bacterium]
NTGNEKDCLAVVEIGNKIPCHAGLVIMQMIQYIEGNEFIINTILKMNRIHIACFEKDPSSTNTSDVYETISCLVMFSPLQTIRNLVSKNFDESIQILNKMRKRPTVAAVLCNALAEVFLATKDEKYIQPIITTCTEMLSYLASYNNEIQDLPDVIKATFKQIKEVVRAYMEKGNKKESLKKINNIVNKKSDIGQFFYSWVVINPSVALNVVMLPAFQIDIISQMISQMKLQHALEMGIIFETEVDNQDKAKVDVMRNYLLQNYNLHNEDEYFDKISDIAKKQTIDHYGILLRYVQFMPVVFVEEGKKYSEYVQELQSKLSSVANNLSADLSQKSLSITIAPMGRSTVYKTIVDQINKENGIQVAAGGFLAKLQEKDVVKKIKESGSSFLVIDQLTGLCAITLFQVIQEATQNIATINDENKNTIVTEAYKLYISKYKMLMTKKQFGMMCEIVFNKITTKPAIDNMDD